MFNKKDIKYVLSPIFLILFIIVLIFVLTNNTQYIDDKIYNFIFGLRSSGFDSFMKIITQLGNPLPVTIVFILLFILLSGTKENLFFVGCNTIITVSSNQLLKHIIRRARPDHLRLIIQNGYSFPSGHAMISICLYGAILYLINSKLKNKTIKILLSILLVLLIFLIGISRIYLGVHYPSDIIGGHLLSLSILILNVYILNKYFRGNKNEKGSNL